MGGGQVVLSLAKSGRIKSVPCTGLTYQKRGLGVCYAKVSGGL